LPHLAGFGLHPAGLPELRALIADRYTEGGTPTGPDQVLITSGALHAWDLLLRTYARPGALVVTEQPTYPGVIDAALAHRVRLRPLPVDGDGWHPEELDAGRAPALVHVTFDGQNPTGRCADRATRNRVMSMFDPSTIVVVDETMVDFVPAGEPLHALGPPRSAGAVVVNVGSTSKSLWAGLRIGWIRGPASLVRRVTTVRASQDLAPSVLSQLVVVEMLRRAEGFMPERRNLVVARRAALLDAISRHCPDWAVVPPEGGLAVWMDLGGRSSTQLAIQARGLGVRITPGTRFTHTGTHDQWLRLPSVLPAERIEGALEKLAVAASNLEPSRPRRHTTAAAAWTA
jgi:DNA-binding transcriptional MocR family regulator